MGVVVHRGGRRERARETAPRANERMDGRMGTLIDT